MNVKSMLVQIGVDLKDLEAGFKKADGYIQGHKEEFRKAGMAITAIGGTIVAALGGAVAQYAKQEAVTRQLEATLESTKGVAGMTKDALLDLASGLQRVTTFGDEAIIEGENLLLTFTQIGKDVFPMATETMLDMSQALGQDMKSSAIQLGKSLNDPIKGVTALQRVGVSFTEDQKKQIETLVKTGDVMGAQKLILAELATEFGGSARAAAETFGGQLKQLKNVLGDAGEQIGSFLIPVLTGLVEKIKPVVEGLMTWMQAHPELARVITIVVGAIGALMAILGPILIMLPALASGFSILLGPIGLVSAAVVGLGALAALIIANWEPIKTFFCNLWKTVSDFFVNAFNSIKSKLLDWALAIAGILEKIPIANKLAAPWKESLEAMRAEMDQTEENIRIAAGKITEESVKLGQAFYEAIKGTTLYKDAALAASQETGILDKGLAILKVGLGALNEGWAAASTGAEEHTKKIAEASEKIVELTKTMNDEIKKATLDEYEYSKWALAQKLLERETAIAAEIASDTEKNAVLALARDAFRKEQLDLEKKHREEEMKGKIEFNEKIREDEIALFYARKQALEEFANAKFELVNAINQMTMNELAYTLWSFAQEYQKRKEHIKNTTQDERKKIELLSLLNKEYLLKKKKAEEEHAAWSLQFQRNVLTSLTTLYHDSIANILTIFEEWGAGTKGILEAVGGFFKDLASSVVQALKDIVAGELTTAAKTIIAEKAKAIASVIAKVMAALPFPLNLAAVGGAIAAVSFLFSKIHLGEGALVMRPTPAVIGERGPEMVIPLKKLGQIGMGTAPVNVKMVNYFYGNITNVGDIDEISRRLAQKTRRAIERGRK